MSKHEIAFRIIAGITEPLDHVNLFLVPAQRKKPASLFVHDSNACFLATPIEELRWDRHLRHARPARGTRGRPSG
jgi:hypothetical protein